MRLTIPQQAGRLERAAFAALLVVGGGVGGHGLTVALTPEPKPVIRTIVLDLPPACAEAIDAARDERAYTATVAKHEALAAEAASARFDAELTLDDDTIADAAEALDAERRKVQQARLDAADAHARFDDAAARCTPEVDR